MHVLFIFVDAHKFLNELNDKNNPVGLAGCEVLGYDTFENSCAYDMVIFDNHGKSDGRQLVRYASDYVVMRHASLSESDLGRLLQYDMMQVLRDPSWDLRILLQKIAAKRKDLYRDYARNSLLQSMFCCQKTQFIFDDYNGPDDVDSAGADGDGFCRNSSFLACADDGSESFEQSCVLASCWQKCAAFYLADALCALNGKKPLPFHMLETLRNLPASLINEHVSIVTETIGMERATQTLLARMVSSTVGFDDRVSDLCDLASHDIDVTSVIDTCPYSEIISKKHDFLVSNSLMTDCYFYLGCVNKQNMHDISNMLHRHPELIHMLKVALDTETDVSLLQQNADAIHKSCNTLFELMSGISTY